MNKKTKKKVSVIFWRKGIVRGLFKNYKEEGIKCVNVKKLLKK